MKHQTRIFFRALVLALATPALAAPPILRQTPAEPVIAEAKAFTIDGLWGQRYTLSWNYQDWAAPYEGTGQIATDVFGAHLAPLLDTLPGLAFDQDQVSARSTYVTANNPHDPVRKWTVTDDSRIVQRFDAHYRTEFIADASDADASIFAYSNDKVTLVGGPNLDILNFAPSSARGTLGVKGLGTHVMSPLPEKAIPGGTWVQTEAWNATIGDVNAVQRVLLVAANGFGGDPLAECALLFARHSGVLVPIVQYQKDDLGIVLMSIEYSAVDHPLRGQVPFPARRYVLVRGADGLSLNIELGEIALLPPPVSFTAMRIPIKDSCLLSYQRTTVTPEELQLIRRHDQATWPQRVLDAITIL